MDTQALGLPSPGARPGRAESSAASPLLSPDAPEIGAFVAALLATVEPPAAQAQNHSAALGAQMLEPPHGKDLPAQGTELAATTELPGEPIELVFAHLAANADRTMSDGFQSTVASPATTTLPAGGLTTQSALLSQAAKFDPKSLKSAPTAAMEQAWLPLTDGPSGANSSELTTILAETATGGRLTPSALNPSLAPADSLNAPIALDDTTTTPVHHRAANELTAFGPSPAKGQALPVNQPDVFADRLNYQVSVMLGQNAQHARLSVNPAELGPVEIWVKVSGEEASVQLVAPHAATREALEDAMPRLRAAFSESGIALTDASVSSDTPDRQPDGASELADERLHSPDSPLQADEPSGQLQRVQLSLVDAFV